MTLSVALLAVLSLFAAPTFGLRCLECSGVATEAECNAVGKIRECRFNEDACEIELRRHEGWGGALKMYKHCKQSKACDDNHVQNPRSAWMPSQCNPETFNSVCRCCCYEDLCNIANEDCFGGTGCGRVPDYINGGTISCSDGRNYGSRCRVTCNSNKRTVGAVNTYCRGDGSWSQPLPLCLDIQCPPRINLVNGWYVCTSSQFSGSRCTANCRPGYTLNGPMHATCLPTGRWNIFREPQCVPLQCPPRGNIAGGSVECTDDQNMQSRCKAICDENRRAVGVLDSYCQDNGEWSHDLPRCELIQCPPRGTIHNGDVGCSDGVDVGSVCQAVCDEGYGLDGVAESTCLPTGQWSEPLPRCIRIQCRKPELKNGEITCTNEQFVGSVCTAQCDPGFQLIGAQVGTCLSSGEWSDRVPTCERIICPVRPPLENGAISCTNRNFVNSFCSAKCNVGYRLVGAPSATCLSTGEWSEPMPTCERITCPELDFSLEPGLMSCTSGFNYGSVCSFQCDAGYRRVGAPRLNCLRQGRWNTRMPSCRLVTCPPRGRIRNGDVDCNDGTNVGSDCQATCDEGYDLVGNPFSSCLPSGRWNAPLPTCERIECPPTGRLPNGAVFCTSGRSVGSDCTSRCDPGFRLVGDTGTTCLPDGRWSNPLPRCVSSPCEDQGELEHGTISCTNENNVRSVCTFTCEDEGYELYPQRRSRNVCQPDQNWNQPKPCCTRPCPPYAVMDIVIVLDSSSSIGDDNWVSLTDFVRGIIRSFVVAPDAANFAIFRYNRAVDEATQIFLNSYPGDIEGLINAFGQIPYDGSGTFTGNGLQHALDVSLSPANGNRPGVKDLVFVITDGKAADDVKTPSDALRAAGATVFALGIEPPRGRLDLGQLNDIAGTPENLVIASGGFAGLDSSFVVQLSSNICPDPCEN